MTAFALLLAVFGLNQLALHAGYGTTFSTFYLDDLLCLPIILSLIQYVQKKRYGPRFTLPLSHIVLSAVFFAVTFEMILPALSNHYTGDPLDAALYFIGGALFYGFNLLPARTYPYRTYRKRIKLIS
jgi:hypothetical protein